jgi:hypothetical protein
LLSTVRWLTLRDHFAEECECGSDELAYGLCHTRAASEPLCLLLLALLFRLVYRGVCPRAEQHLEALLQLFMPDTRATSRTLDSISSAARARSCLAESVASSVS